jgi:hypothetical protein
VSSGKFGGYDQGSSTSARSRANSTTRAGPWGVTSDTIGMPAPASTRRNSRNRSLPRRSRWWPTSESRPQSGIIEAASSAPRDGPGPLESGFEVVPCPVRPACPALPAALAEGGEEAGEPVRLAGGEGVGVGTRAGRERRGPPRRLHPGLQVRRRLVEVARLVGVRHPDLALAGRALDHRARLARGDAQQLVAETAVETDRHGGRPIGTARPLPGFSLVSTSGASAPVRSLH